MPDPTREAPPVCFGGPLWDPKAKECAGGLDPAFTDDSGSHVRHRCLFFNECGTRSQASRMEPARGLLDPKSLLKNNVPILGPTRPVQEQPQNQLAGFVERFASSIAQQSAQVQYNHQGQSRPIHLPPQQVYQHQQQYGYQQMMPVNYQMPGYLTVPEVRVENQSFWSFLMKTIFAEPPDPPIGRGSGGLGRNLPHLSLSVRSTREVGNPGLDLSKNRSTKIPTPLFGPSFGGPE